MDACSFPQKKVTYFRDAPAYFYQKVYICAPSYMEAKGFSELAFGGFLKEEIFLFPIQNLIF